MDDEQLRRAHRLLRRAADHAASAPVESGARRETVGLVDVVTHPLSTAPDLNYLTPRRGVGWLSASQLRPGLERLRECGRAPCVMLVEGLLPPQFTAELRSIGLVPVRQSPLMVYAVEGVLSPPPSPAPDTRPHAVIAVSDRDGDRVWRGITANAGIRLLASPYLPRTFHPTMTRRANAPDDTSPLSREEQETDPVLQLLEPYTPVVEQDGTAPFASVPGAWALTRRGALIGMLRADVQTRAGSVLIRGASVLGAGDMLAALLNGALRDWLHLGCDLALALAASESDRAACRMIGFVDVGEIVWYTLPGLQPHPTTAQAEADDVITPPLAFAVPARQ